MNIGPVIASFLLVAIATAFGLVLIRKGQRDREWHLVVVQRNTQTRRYALVMIGQAIIIAGVAWLVTANTADDIKSGIGTCFTKGPAGYVLATLVLLAFASPLITGSALLNILRHPCEMAHKGRAKNSYCPTRFHREGNCRFLNITATLDLKTGKGTQYRN